MTSQAKIEANRRNAQKSSGPRTAEGKERVRLNAVKHGLTATTVVLPHEDAEAYQERREAWTRELDPPGELGLYLADRVVRISWQLDRADAHERARLAARVRSQPRDKARSAQRRVDGLMRKLFSSAGGSDTGPEHRYDLRGSRVGGTARRVGVDADPAVLIDKLESSAEGCRRLLAEWQSCLQELEDWIKDDASPGWGLADRNRLLRLFGYRAEEAEAVAALDRRIALVMRVQKLAEDLAVTQIWAETAKNDDDDDPPEFEPRPVQTASDHGQDHARLKREFQLILEEQCARLESLLAGHEAEETPEEPADLAERAAFDDSAEGERLHRYQTHWSRTLLRTLDALARLRKSGEQEEPADRGAGPASRDQSCHSVHQEEARLESCPTPQARSESCPTPQARSVPARRDCPTGTGPNGARERLDTSIHSARNKPTEESQHQPRERGYDRDNGPGAPRRRFEPSPPGRRCPKGG
jgi:hypothetical protein